MYAVIETGGKQHRVVEGEKLKIDLMRDLNAGDKITFERVLMLGGDDIKIGQPFVEGAKVSATVTDMGTDGEGVKDKKIYVFKKIRRHGYHKTRGHRQRHSEVQIDKIEG